MRILLIQPPKAPTVIGGEDMHIYEPLDLEYIAAGVDDRHAVKILDMRFDKGLEACLAEFAPEVVGLTAYTTHVSVVKALCLRIKRALPSALTVVGGHHATACPHDFEVDGVDVVVAGEGVFSFRELVVAMEGGSAGVRALLDANGPAGTRILHSKYNLEPLDNYPFPRRDLTLDHRKEYFSEWMKPLATIVTSKGCPFRCDFCCLWKETGGRYLERSPESIVRELESIEEKNIFFADAESMLNVPRMTRLAELIQERGIDKKYFCYSRSDSVTEHPELYKKWREVGLERVFVGFEFFRNDDLGDVRKRATVEENEAAMRVLNDLDISIIASYLVRPEFTREDFREFAAYCRRLKQQMKFSMFLFSVLTPLPGTDYYEATKDRLVTRDYDHFDLFHTVLPTTLPLKDFFEEVHGLYQAVNGPREMIPILKQFKMLEVPRIIKRYHRVAVQMRNAYRDYETAESTGRCP